MGGVCQCGQAPPVVDEPRDTEKGEDADNPAKVEVKEFVSEKQDMRNFTMILHGAHLNRSFAKVGWMDPYALVIVDGKEVERTQPHKGAHKEPHWDVAHTWKAAEVPESIKVAIWDKNNFHRDVFCGSVTVPCSIDMGSQAERDFTLTKRDQPTGLLTITLKVENADGQDTTEENALERVPTGLGMELDGLVEFSTSRSRTTAMVQLREHDVAGHEDDGDQDKVVKRPSKKMDDSGGQVAGPLIGSWKCVETHGLDDFLKATGVGVFQRKIANAAKWPGWEFKVVDGKLIFINHSALGDLLETIVLGEEYDWKDGRDNAFKCMATWTNNDNGGVLLMKRTGGVGNYQEERTVTGNSLKFTLTHEKTGVT